MIPVCEPMLTEKVLSYATDAIKSGWISSGGKYIKQFENEFSHYCGVEHGITTTNGTTALHLALLAAGIKPGDEVILPDFTMAATLFAVLYVGATPVLIDADPVTWNLNVNQIEARITTRTKAIMPVHIYGHPVDMDKVVDIARTYNLQVIEDAAEAHGALYKGKKCGSIGDLGCFSFYANKIITTGEGGMVITNNPELAEKCQYYKNLCFPIKGERIYQHDDLGFNFRMTNVQAAIGLAQLENIDVYIDARRFHAHSYKSKLAGIPGITLPAEKENVRNVYWMFSILIDPVEFGVSRDQLVAELKLRNIDTRKFFIPMHRLHVLEKFDHHFNDEEYPVSNRLSAEGLYLPSSSGLKEEEIDYICKQILDIYQFNH